MSGHDDACPLPNVPSESCGFCRVIHITRSKARAEFEKVWGENLPLVEQRAARDERMAIEKRVRESGVARWLPSHAWDTLIEAIRGSRG